MSGRERIGIGGRFMQEYATRRKRRNHSAEFKVKIALVAIKGDHTLAELST